MNIKTSNGTKSPSLFRWSKSKSEVDLLLDLLIKEGHEQISIAQINAYVAEHLSKRQTNFLGWTLKSPYIYDTVNIRLWSVLKVNYVFFFFLSAPYPWILSTSTSKLRSGAYCTYWTWNREQFILNLGLTNEHQRLHRLGIVKNPITVS